MLCTRNFVVELLFVASVVSDEMKYLTVWRWRATLSTRLSGFGIPAPENASTEASDVAERRS